MLDQKALKEMLDLGPDGFLEKMREAVAIPDAPLTDSNAHASPNAVAMHVCRKFIRVIDRLKEPDARASWSAMAVDELPDCIDEELGKKLYANLYDKLLQFSIAVICSEIAEVVASLDAGENDGTDILHALIREITEAKLFGEEGLGLTQALKEAGIDVKGLDAGTYIGTFDAATGKASLTPVDDDDGPEEIDAKISLAKAKPEGSA